MKIEVTPPSVLEADVEHKEGKLTSKPRHYDKKGNGSSPAYIIQCKSDDGKKTFFQGMLMVSGRTGKCVLVERTNPVGPAIEKRNVEELDVK